MTVNETTHGKGHNGVAADELRSYIERIERLEGEKEATAIDIREVYAEAKGTGFDVKAMRQIVRLRKMESSDRAEQEAMLDLYKRSLGMLADTPLGQAAVRSNTVEATVGRGVAA